VEARERLVGIALPRRCERLREVVLLGEQVGGPIAHAAGFDEHHLGGVGEEIGEQLVVIDQPRHPRLHPVEMGALGEPLPLLAAPRLGRHQSGGALAHVGRGGELAGGEDERVLEVGDRALVVDGERREAVDLVAPQVDADRRVGGRREHVDDGAASCELAAVLHQLLATVAERDQPGGQLVGVDDRPGPYRDRFDVGGTGPELLEERAHAGHDHSWAAIGGREVATGASRRWPMVSTFGETRSNGSVSHAGKRTTSSAPRNCWRSSDS
jgi:hypothetical protein